MGWIKIHDLFRILIVEEGLNDEFIEKLYLSDTFILGPEIDGVYTVDSQLIIEEFKKIISDMWKIVVVNQDAEGYLLMSPNGDTQWVNESDYLELKNAGKIDTNI